MVKDHLDRDIGNPLPPLQGLLFSFRSKDPFYAPSQGHDSTCHGLCYTSRGTLVEIAQWVHHKGSIRRPSITE